MQTLAMSASHYLALSDYLIEHYKPLCIRIVQHLDRIFSPIFSLISSCCVSLLLIFFYLSLRFISYVIYTQQP